MSSPLINSTPNYVRVDDERFEVVDRTIKKVGDYMYVTLKYKKPLKTAPTKDKP